MASLNTCPGSRAQIWCPVLHLTIFLDGIDRIKGMLGLK